MTVTAAADPPPGVDANLEHPTDVIRTINFATQGLTLLFIPAFVCIRFVSSRNRAAGLGFTVDDCFTAISCLLMIGYSICGIFLSVYGGGYHIWEVPSTHLKPFYKTAYAATIFYAPMALFVKLSLLSIIARVFSPYRKTIHGIYALAILLICYYISQLVVKVRICMPISAYWSGDTSKCLDQAAIITADSIISLISDLVILVLPLPLTWSLQLPRNKKLRVAAMMCVGGLATAFSAWRLDLILTDGKSRDQTIVFVQVVLSGNAEAGIGLICACLPATTALFHHLRGNTTRSTSHNRTSRSFALSSFSSPRAVKERGLFKNLEAASGSTDDGTTLVTHAQGFREEESLGGQKGIYRRVEVRHEVSLAEEIEEGRREEKSGVA